VLAQPSLQHVPIGSRLALLSCNAPHHAQHFGRVSAQRRRRVLRRALTRSQRAPPLRPRRLLRSSVRGSLARRPRAPSVLLRSARHRAGRPSRCRATRCMTGRAGTSLNTTCAPPSMSLPAFPRAGCLTTLLHQVLWRGQHVGRYAAPCLRQDVLGKPFTAHRHVARPVRAYAAPV
jgi:hypothetical protein